MHNKRNGSGTREHNHNRNHTQSRQIVKLIRNLTVLKNNVHLLSNNSNNFERILSEFDNALFPFVSHIHSRLPSHSHSHSHAPSYVQPSFQHMNSDNRDPVSDHYFNHNHNHLSNRFHANHLHPNHLHNALHTRAHASREFAQEINDQFEMPFLSSLLQFLPTESQLQSPIESHRSLSIFQGMPDNLGLDVRGVETAGQGNSVWDVTSQFLQQIQQSSSIFGPHSPHNVRFEQYDTPNGMHVSISHINSEDTTNSVDSSLLDSIMQLANTLNPIEQGSNSTVGNPLPIKYRSRLPIAKYCEAKIDSDDNSYMCTICQSEYEDDTEVLCLPCTHLFHESCINNWLDKSSECPNCRTDIKASSSFWGQDPTGSNENKDSD